MGEPAKSAARLGFEAHAHAKRWREAYHAYAALNMYEMLRAYRDLAPATRAEFWRARDGKTPGAGCNPDLPNVPPGALPRTAYAVTVVDAGQMPDGVPPGDLAQTGQEEDAREYLAPVRDPLAGLTYTRLSTAYPVGPPAAVKSAIGGKVDAGWIENTCAIRVSRVLNATGFAIPGPAAKQMDVISGGDGRWYAYRQAQLQAWLRGRVGAPSVELAKSTGGVVDRRKLKNLQGVIGFDIRGWTDATGHIDLWDGERFGTEPQATHDYFALASSVAFWRVPTWTRR